MRLLSTAFNKNINSNFIRIRNTKLVDYESSRAQICFTILQSLEIPPERNRDKSYSKDPYFIFRKTFRDGIELRQDRYLSMSRLSNQSPFGNLSHGVFSSVDLFFRRRKPMNITGVVSGNPRLHHIKTVFNTPFQLTIVRLYRATMFVCMLILLKLVLYLHPDLARSKNPMEHS